MVNEPSCMNYRAGPWLCEQLDELGRSDYVHDETADRIISAIKDSALAERGMEDKCRPMPLPQFDKSAIKEFTNHIYREKNKRSAGTIEQMRTSMNGIAKHYCLLTQCSGAGKTHATYMLGLDDTCPRLAILCNVATKDKDCSQCSKLTPPWLIICNVCDSLHGLLNRHGRAHRKELGKAAYAVVVLVFACYAEYVSQIIDAVDNKMEAQSHAEVSKDRRRRLTALFGLRNGRGEQGVAKLLRESFQSGAIDEERTLGSKTYCLPNYQLAWDKLNAAVEGLNTRLFVKDANYGPTKVIFCVDELQALVGKCSDIVMFQSEIFENWSPGQGDGKADLVYTISIVCRVLLSEAGGKMNCGSVLLGTHASFGNLRKQSEVSATKFHYQEYHDLELFDTNMIRRLVNVYFDCDKTGIWDEALGDPKFCEHIESLVGRPLWTRFLIDSLDTLNFLKSACKVDQLKHCAETASTQAKTYLKDLVRAAFLSDKLISTKAKKADGENNGKSTEPESNATMVLFLSLLLDVQHVPMTHNVLDALMAHGVGCLENEKRCLKIEEEPMVQTIVEEVGIELLNDKRDWFMECAMDTGTKMITNDCYIKSAGLGEEFEPLLAQWILLRCLKQDDPSLWSIFEPMLEYLTTSSLEGAKTIIDRLKEIKVKLRRCKTTKKKSTPGNVETELWEFFKANETAETGNGMVPDLTLLLCDLANLMGFDLTFLARDEKHNNKTCSVSIQCKVKTSENLGKAIITTDPNLQYVSNTGRNEWIVSNERKASTKDDSSTKHVKLPRSRKTGGRDSFERLRSCLGEHDPYLQCIRFVSGTFRQESYDASIRLAVMERYPVLLLDIRKILPEIVDKKNGISKSQMKEMTHLSESSILWPGVPPIEWEDEDQTPTAGPTGKRKEPHEPKKSGQRQKGRHQKKTEKAIQPSATAASFSPHEDKTPKGKEPHQPKESGQRRKKRGRQQATEKSTQPSAASFQGTGKAGGEEAAQDQSGASVAASSDPSRQSSQHKAETKKYWKHA